MQNQQPIPHNLNADVYAAAFVKVFKCSKADIQIVVSYDREAALIIYKNKKYLIEPYISLYGQLQSHLTDITIAQYLDIDKVMSATGGITRNVEFHCLLIQLLTTDQERILYNLAVTVTSIVNTGDESLWRLLRPLDNTGILFGKAVLAAAKTIGIDVLTKKLLELQIEDGLNIYSQVTNGVFEILTVELGDNEIVELFLYSVSESTMVI